MGLSWKGLRRGHRKGVWKGTSDIVTRYCQQTVYDSNNLTTTVNPCSMAM